VCVCEVHMCLCCVAFVSTCRYTVCSQNVVTIICRMQQNQSKCHPKLHLMIKGENDDRENRPFDLKFS